MGSTDTSGNTAALKNAKSAYSQYNKDYGNWKNQYNQYRQTADEMFARDYGNSASEFTQKANNTGIQNANQQLSVGASAANNQSQLASRQAGLSKGQAAMNAAGASNQMFQNNWNDAVQQGVQNYGNAANFGQQSQQQRMSNSKDLMGQANQGMQGAIGGQAQVGSQQKSEWDKNMGVTGIVGGFLSSDARAKIIDDDFYNDILRRLGALGR